MIVFVPEDMKYISNELKNRGYEVTNNKDMPCDIIICDLKNHGLLDANLENNLKAEGTLIIDSGKKTVDEIDRIIFNRVYSSIY
ncbi:YkuS family protein [Haloimpatiens lingqiaonensis]|uniref:YkuS family protein n=1 Tax=Haloimpatiens lingqiaonensis TaxID=1380675 RepID=UPI0010FF3761|nr:YkuS family protein [Haloimpatiens lingqiaonensis]